MNCLRLLLVWTLLLQGLFSAAKSHENPNVSCPLPAPGWITAPEITTNSIKITWEGVSGATHYKISRFDVTNNVQLSDAYATEPEYVSQPHDPGTTISFEVRATACGQNGEYGSPITGEYTTNIIIVDIIANFSAPNTPGGNYPIYPGGTSNGMNLTLTDAGAGTDTVGVFRVKVKYTDGFSNLHFAEVLLWSHCSTPEAGAARVQYWAQSSWPSSVTYVEHHVGGGASGPIDSIFFKINGGEFFTLHSPMFVQGVGQEPNIMRLRLRNDRSETIYFDRSINYNDNPCYVQKRMRNKVDYISANEHAAADRENVVPERVAAPLTVRPNPCADGFRADYELTEQSPVLFTLFDAAGRVVRTMNLSTLEAGKYNTYISTEHLPTGVYLLSCQTNQGRTVTTVVKHN